MKSATGRRRLKNAGYLVGTLLTVAMSLAPVAAQAQYNFTIFAYPGTTGLYTAGINDEGVSVGSAILPQGIQGFVRSAAGTFSFFSFLGTVNAYGINDSDAIVGVAFLGPHAKEGFIFSNGNVTPVGPGGRTELVGINNAGVSVGTEDFLATSMGVIDNRGFLTEFKYPGARFTRAAAINNIGVTAGNYSVVVNGQRQEFAFLYKNGVFSQFVCSLTPSPIIAGMNDAGTIVGTYIPSTGSIESFISRNGVCLPFTGPGGEAVRVTGINNEGVIVGNLFDQVTSFIATPAQ